MVDVQSHSPADSAQPSLNGRLTVCTANLASLIQVFGKTMMCKDYDVAKSVAQRDNLDGILMDGTQVFKKGVYRGGYYDKSRHAF